MISFRQYVLEGILERTINLTPFEKADLNILLTVAKEDDGNFKANYQNRLIKKYGVLLTDSPEFERVSKMVPDAKKHSSQEIKSKYNIDLDPQAGGILFIFRETHRSPRTIILVHSSIESMIFVKEISYDEKQSKTVYEDDIWVSGQNDETKIDHLITNLS